MVGPRDAPVLQELMRHENIETTMKYYVGRNAERTADALWDAYDRQQPKQEPEKKQQPDGLPDVGGVLGGSGEKGPSETAANTVLQVPPEGLEPSTL